MLFKCEYLGFVLEVVYGCGVRAACCDTKRRVFCGLEFLDVGVCNVWVPCWVCISKDGADELFIYSCNVLLGKSSEDVQAGLCFGVDPIGMLPERHSSVIGHSKDGGG